MKVSEQLKQEISKIVEKYNINYGGCCYLAYLIAQQLERLGQKFKLEIEEGEDIGQHFCIYSDKLGVINGLPKYDNMIRVELTSITILAIYEDKSNRWSLKYNKEDCISIQNEVNKVFTDIFGVPININYVDKHKFHITTFSELMNYVKK